MGFNKNDIYVEGGDNKILHIWTPGVEKFDTSSFYNWEQDNIPLYDLEERTYYLWEKAGWPTSGSPQVSGVVFSVSADALGTQAYVDNPNIFLSLSGALDALPDIIRYPVRIEVGNYGDLGELVLNNVHFTGSGALEIVNRNYAHINSGPGMGDYALSSMAKSVGAGAAAGYTAGTNTDVYVTEVSSPDLRNTLTDTSCLGISTAIAATSTPDDPRWEDNTIILGQMVHETRDPDGEWVKTAKMTASLYHTDAVATTDIFSLTNYGADNDLSISAFDISSVTNEITEDSATMRRDYDTTKTPYDAADGVGLVGEFYGNRLSKIEVNNCGGPIYIRNFAVDGALGVSVPTKYTTRHGININNSEVVLEHCAAMRCYETGFNLVNSNVILSRGAWAYRNYALSSNLGYGYDRDTTIKGVGFNLFNSNVVLSSVGEYAASGANAAFASTRNDRGMVMYNSILTGGDKRLTGTDSQSMTSLQLFENSNRGLLMNSSKLDLDGAIDIWLHPVGLEATNSDILIDELYVDHTQTLGVELKNSHLVYAKNAPNIVKKTLVPGAQRGNANSPQFNSGSYYEWEDAPGMVMMDTNGQHLALNNSKYTHPRLVDAAGLSRCKYKRNRGASPAQTDTLLSIPAIILENNSLAHLTYARIQAQTGTSFGAGGNNEAIPTDGNGVGRGGTSNANYGACLLVKDNSTCRLVGGDGKFTWLDGPSDYPDQIYTANAYVNNGSNLKVHGPTLISRAGVNVLVDNDSVLDICPPKDEYGFIDNEQWDLGTVQQNQTKVDLQSSRACLVANNNSVINMEDCGDFNGQWAKKAADEVVTGDADAWVASGLVLSANYSTYETSAWHTHGSIQFYPNPQLQTEDAGGPGEVPYDMAGSVVATRGATDEQTFPLADNATDIATLSKGGMCVRSMKGSRVNVRNVNFPAGWNNTSALYYNYSLTDVDPQGCEQLRIWNIDSTSKLDMSYGSVSGHFPPLVGYNGPSAVYVVDGEGCTSAGVPDSTLFTSTLSVLDSFGSSGTPGNTHSDGQNFGAFRLYFAPKQFAKYLVYNNQPSGETGVIYQTIAQGYNMSGSCSSIFLTTSSGPDLYSVYGAGPTSPSGIQGAISVSSLTASAWFSSSEFGRCKDFRNYTSAIAYTVSGRGACTAGLRGESVGQARGDGIPGWDSSCIHRGYVEPYFKHYKESNFFYAKDLLPQDYDSRIILDESAIAVFANAKNATLGTAGRPKLVTMKTSTTSFAGEGAQSENDLAGKGFLSASEFDLNKLD